MNAKLKHSHLPHLSAFAEQPIVFITTTTDKRRTFLHAAEAHKILHSLWAHSARENGWYVGDYVLMPDHAHLFAMAARHAIALEHWVKMWKSVSARSLSTALDVRPPIWQPDYFDRYLRSSDVYAEKWAYVQMNPVRAGFVSQPERWPYQGRIHTLCV